MNEPNGLDFSTFPIMVTKRLTLREPLLSDASDILIFRGDPEVQKYNGPVMQNVAEVETLIEEVRAEYSAREGVTWAVTCTNSETVLGLFGFHYWNKYHRRIELGYDLARAYWGQGIASEAVRATVRFGFERMNLNRIYARTIADNYEFVRLLERVGFQREGTQRKHSWEDDGTFHDSAIYGLLGMNTQKEIMMIEISIMIEATWGLTWPRWQKLAALVEELGFAGLYRSDHFPGGQELLELVVSLTYLANSTRRIHFSSLVAPLSFRDPRLLARQAAAIDDLSGGRMILGLGTGWQPREHEVWGYELGDSATRYARFEEGLDVITQLLRSDEPVTFEGQFFQLQEALLLPRPQRRQGPPILIGGNGPRRTLPLVARYADIWNANNLSLDAFRQRSAVLDELITQAGRRPCEVKRTVMVMVWCGSTEDELIQRLRPIHQLLPNLVDLPFKEQLGQMEATFTPVLEKAGAMFAPIFGTPDEVIEQIRAFEAAGAQELILQWFDLDDLDGLKLVADRVLPQLSARGS